jgi:hypothetical protein
MTLNSGINRFVFVVPERHAATSEVPEEIDTEASLEVNVIFTTEKHACTALKVAGSLAQNLNAHLNLVAVKEVPLGFPIDRPPVAIPFTQRRLYELASQGVQGPLDTTVRLYYCRNKLQGLLQALKPKSLVIIGGSERLWPTKTSRLVRILRGKGHQVIFPTDK